MDAGELTGDNFKPAGSGTQAEPYSIATPEAFAWWALLHPDAHATLASDIDLTARTNADGEPLPWPGDTALAATLDGAGHSVSFVTEGAGLFAEIAESGTAEWLFLGESLDAAKRPSKVASAETLAGALAGTNKGTVQGVVNRLPVSVAEAADGASATAREAFAGGIVAVNDGVVRDCANLGDVQNPSAQGNSAAAGIAAQGVGRVETSYNAGNVRAAQNGAYLMTLLTFDGTYDDIVDDASCYLAAGEATYEGIAQAGADRKGALSSDELKAASERLNAGREGDAAVWSAGASAASGYPAPAKPQDENAPVEQANALVAEPRATTFASWADVGAYLASKMNGAGQSCTLPDGGPTISWPATDATTKTIYIDNAEQLALVTHLANNGSSAQTANIVLREDIDLSGTPYINKTFGAIEDALPWVPMGTSSKPFTGTFDGGGHAVSSMFIAATDHVAGLFGTVGSTSATTCVSIKNVSVNGRINVNAANKNSFGGIVGKLSAGNSKIDGSDAASVERCSSSVEILAPNGLSFAGGVVGYATGSIGIRQCSYNGTLGGVFSGATFSMSGGIVGSAAIGVSIVDCFSRALFAGAGGFSMVGGIAGVYSCAQGEISNCYSAIPTSNVPASASGICAVIGSAVGTPTVSNCYYASDGIAPGSYNANWQTVPLANMQFLAFVEALNGSRTDAPWSSDPSGGNGGFPVLSATPHDTFSSWYDVGRFFDGNTSSGSCKFPDGTIIPRPETTSTGSSRTMFIEYPEQLALVMYRVNGGESFSSSIVIVLTADIDLSGGRYCSTGSLPWVPMGTEATPFNNIFDGGGYTVSNMYVPVASSSSLTGNIGLFGYAGNSSNYTIGNLHVQGRIDLSKEGLENIGGVVGNFNPNGVPGCTIKRCTSDVDIRLAQSGAEIATQRVGGVVGLAKQASISECSYTGKIGGPAGANSSQYRATHVGGIAGLVEEGTVSEATRTITDCFNRGVFSDFTPTSGNGLGGIVGVFGANMGQLEMKYCYSTIGSSDVPASAPANSVGALIGRNRGKISQCYYSSDGGLSPVGVEENSTGATYLNQILVAMQDSSFAIILNDGRTGTDETATDGSYAPWSADGSGDNGGFPVLKSNLGPKYADWLDVGQAVDAGDLPGKPADPNASTIEVSMPETLAWVAYKGTTEQYGSILTSGKVLNIANDIDLTGVDYGGTEAAPLRWPGFFSLGAEINGNGHTVRGVNVYQADGTSTYNAGLITTMEGGSLKGLTIADSSIKDADKAGALVGMTSLGAAIERCSVGKSVTVSGESYAGGLIGYEGSGTVTDCLSRASVSSSKGCPGGIVGKASKTKFSNCLGAPTALVKGTDKSSGAIVGDHNSATVSNCYYDSSLPGDIGMGTPKTTAELTELRGAAVAGLLDGDRSGETSVWRADFSATNDGYPVLRPGGEQAVLSWLDVGKLANDGVIRRADGTGYFPRHETAGDLYPIDAPESLASVWSGLFASYSNINVQLKADIDLMGAMYTNNSGEPLAWMMLPQRTSGAYKATFDGGSHTISNMRAVVNPNAGAYTSSNEYAGFFTTLGDGAVVKDLNFVSSTAEGKYAGIVVGAIGGTVMGQAEGNTTVSRCSVAADCTVTGLTPAGIAGTVYAGKTNPSIVEDCFSRATIAGTANTAAGIAGAVCRQTPYATSGIIPAGKVQIRHCYSAGSLSAPTSNVYVNGLVGLHENSTLDLEKCIYPDTVPGVKSVSGALTNTSEARTLEAMRESDGAVLSVFLNDGRAASSVWRADWFAKNDGYPVLGKSDDPTITSWEDVGQLVANKQIEGEPYSPEHDGSSPEKALIIDSPEGLAWLEYAISVAPDMFKSAYVKLSADIDMFGTKYTGIEPTAPADAGSALPGNIEKALPWVSICESDDGFAGTFDGGGHTVSRLYRSGEGKSGLFKALIGGARCENVVVAESLLESTDMYCGAIAGEIEWSTVSGCASVDNLVKGAYSAGGVVGRVGSESSIEDCYSRSKVESVADFAYGGIAGGMMGMAGGGFSMSHCYSAGTVVASGGKNQKGALAGSLDAAGSNDLFVDCFYRQGDAANAVGYAPPEIYRPGTMTAKTEAQLTSLDMPALLNAGRADGPWAADLAAKNDGYPVIGQTLNFTNWQQVGASVTEDQLRLWPVYNSDGTADGFALTGDGKSTDTAFVLKTPEALAWFAYQTNTKPLDPVATDSSLTWLNAYVKLGADIDLSGTVYTGVSAADLGNTSAKALAWTAFQRSGNVFDGGSHRVKYCSTNFFGPLNNATVQDFSTDVTCSRTEIGSAAIVAASARNTTFLRCANYANLTSSRTSDNAYVGGFVPLDGQGDGTKYYLTFRDCLNAGNIALTTTGGTDRNVGGFVGYGYTAGSSFYNCYNTGKISGGNHRGAFTAHNKAIEKLNNFFLTGVSNSDFGVSLTADQMRTWGMAADLNGKAAGAGTVWTQDATVNDGYPTPTGLTGTPLPAANWQRVGLAVYQSEGKYGLSKPALELGAMDGTAAHPIELGTTEALAYYQYMMGSYATVDTVAGSGVTWKNASIKLTDDISLAGKYNGVNTDGTAKAATQWVPISTLSGTFDGNGHTVSDMVMTSGNEAFIKTLDSGTVKNLTVQGPVEGISAASAGIVYSATGTSRIEDCVNNKTLRSNQQSSQAGVVFQASGSVVIARCTNKGFMTWQGTIGSGSAGSVGGIVGILGAGCTVMDCCNVMTVDGNSCYLGGIAGRSEGTIKNSYNVGSLYNKYNAHPSDIVGTGSGTVDNCYATTSYGTLPAGVTRVSQSAMKSVLMAFQLNNGRTNIDDPANADYAPWTWNALVNSGYPSFGTPKVTQLDTWEDVAKLQQEDALRRTKVTFTEGYGYAGEVQTAEPSGGNYTAALSGAGTSGDAYVVSTPEALAWVAWQVNQNANTVTELYVELGAGIDLAGLDYTGKAADGVGDKYKNCLKWMPMGTYRGSGTPGSTFTGGFDGKNLPIKNLYVNGPNYYAALIGYMGSSTVDTTVKNIVLKSGYSSTTAYASALIGEVIGRVQVQNCRNEGVSVETTTGSIAGGLVASAARGNSLVLERCSNHAPVTSISDASGLVGSYAYGATVNNCYNTGHIEAIGAGGKAAGIYSRTDSSIRISNSYNAGEIVVPSSGTAYAVGSPDATMSNCWYDSEKASDVTPRAGATGVTPTQLKSWGAAFQLNGGTSLSSVNNASTWRMANVGENDGYPVPIAAGTTGSAGHLRAASTWLEVGAWVDTFATNLKPGAASGATGTLGSSGNKYQISRPEQLAWLSYISRDGSAHVGGHSAKLTTDISLDGATYTGQTEAAVISDVKKALQWRGIGFRTEGDNYSLAYRSTFDGGECTVTHLYEELDDTAKDENVGLFNILGDGAVVSDFAVNSSYLSVAAQDRGVGAITGMLSNNATVKKCAAGVGVSIVASGASNQGVGGITGTSTDTTKGLISHCTNRATVTVANNASGKLAIGGITGYLPGGYVVEDCENYGNVQASGTYAANFPQAVGGIVGRILTGSVPATVQRCSSAAGVTVKGPGYTGGIVGSASGGTVKDCYALSNVTEGEGVGGVIGWMLASNVAVSNCYAAGKVNTSGGMVAGGGSGSVTNCYGMTQDGSSSKILGATGPTVDAVSSMKSSEQMQNAMLAVALNAKRFNAEAPWGWKSDVNNAYPNLTTGQALVTSWAEVGAAQTEKELRAANELTGSGTSDDPFAISTPRALAWWAYQVNNHDGDKTHQADSTTETAITYANSHVKLAAPISLAGLSYRGDNAVDMGSNYENGLIWEPVGKWSVDPDHWGEGVSYDGTFDGCGRMITNLHLVHNATYSTGFFGLVSDSAVVKRVGLASGATSLGSNSDAVGSLIGWNYGTVENCYSLVSMVDATSVGEFVGGLLGHNEDGVLKNSYFAGASSVTDLDGIVGLDESSSGDAISNCFATCATSHGTQVTESQLKSWGGAYQLNDPRNADGTYKPVANNNVWKQDVDTKDAPKVNKGYPVLIAEGSGERMQDPTNWSYVGSWVGAFATDLKPKGSGIPTDMFKIGTPEALAWFSNYVNDTPTSAAAGKEDAVLTADIDLLGKQFTGKTSAGANYVDTLSWSSIGIRGTNTYKGTFDGDGHAVKNMRTGMISNGDAAAGFVNYAQDSAFKDLAVDGRVTAYVSKAGTHAQAGLIAGDTKGSSFTGCSTSGEVYADGQTAGVAYAGGIVGGLEGGSVTDCSSTASVTSTTSSKDISAAGGLVGRIASGGSAVSIERCAYRGTVQDTASGGAAGGLLGLSHDTTDVKMQDCSAAGTVSAELFVGGIAGYAGGKFTLSNSYSRASVTGTDGLTWVSGLLGFASGSYVEDSLISRCFWLKGATSLDAEAAGNIDTRDVAELSDVQLKGRVDMKAEGAPTAGLGGTNVVDVLNTMDSGERTGSAAVWIVAPDKRNDGYPDFETASVVETGTATVSPSTGMAATSGSSDVGASSVVLTKMNLLRPPRLYDGSGTAANPLKTPTWELVSGSSVADNYALWAGGSDAQASADKKLGLFVTTTQTGGAESDLSGHDGYTNPDMGAMGGFRVRAAAAYGETEPRTVEFLLTDKLGDVRRQTVTISGVTARTLDVTVPVEANLGSITPDAKLHTGTTAASAKDDSVVQNKTEAPVQGSVTSVSALAAETATETQIGSDGTPLKVNTVLPTKGGTATLIANNRSIVDAANPNAKLGVKGTETSGLATLDKALYTGAIAGDAPGTLPLAMTLAGGTATVPRKVGFRWFLDYTGTWIGDDAVYGYAASYRFAPATKDVLPDTPASIGEAASK